jgi:hypothetical protein
MAQEITGQDLQQIVTDFQQWGRDFRAEVAGRVTEHPKAYATYVELRDYDARGTIDAQLRHAITHDNWKAVVERHGQVPTLAEQVRAAAMAHRRDQHHTTERRDHTRDQGGPGYGF